MLGLTNHAGDAVHAATDELNVKLSQVVASTTVDLIINDPTARTDDNNPIRIIRRAETNLGDLCADAFLDQAGEADISFASSGNIRAEIPKGDITLGEILNVHPFNSNLTVIEVTGQQVLDALEWSVHALPSEFGGFNQIAGLSFTYDSSVDCPCVQDDDGFFDHIDEGAERRIQSVTVGDEPLDPAKTYKLAGIDYQLTNHGDGYTMYDGANILQNAVKLDNQVLIEYITETLGGTIGAGYEEPYGQGRIIEVNTAE